MAACLDPSTAAAADAPRWNVLFLFADDARHAATRETLAGELLDRLRRAGDPRLEDDPPFDRSPFTDPAPGRSSAVPR